MVTVAMKKLTPWKKSYDQPRQHIKKQRHYFANKGPSSQSYGFSSSHVWMWELVYKESWVLKNWCFWTVVLRRLLRVPWTARRSNQSILKEISPEYSLEGLLLKLKLWYFGHMMQRMDSLEKTLILGKTEGKRRKGWQRMKWLGSITDSMDMNLSKFREIMEDTRAWYATGDNRGWDGWMASLTQWTWIWINSRSWWWTGRPGVLQSMESQRAGHNWATELTGWLNSHLCLMFTWPSFLYLCVPISFLLYRSNHWI